MDEQLNKLLADVILKEMSMNREPSAAAEKAAKAYKAGLVAFRGPVTSAAQPAGLPAAQ